jgi:ATP-binding cassette subfamily G (WHITE) protein 2 (PDR)
MFVDGQVRDQSFQRNTGYVMQQDIHLSISTVRETLEFSALLRQSPEYMREERLAYVDEVIRILEMEDYADAIVGVAGSGLNVERTYTRSAPPNPVSKLTVSRTQAPHDWC